MTGFHPQEVESEVGSEAPLQPRHPRKNLLLGATIEAGALKAPVRLRNISMTGAMLEGAVLPDPGVKLLLQRSDIQVTATVVWRVMGRCGIHFDDTTISVDEWVAGARSPSFNGQQGQARVDAIQGAVRSGAALPVETHAASVGVTLSQLEERVVEEIVYVRRLLEALGEEITDDPIVVQRHTRALQNLDRASQMLEHLAEILSASDRMGAAEKVKMQDLRTRLLRKPNF